MILLVALSAVQLENAKTVAAWVAMLVRNAKCLTLLAAPVASKLRFLSALPLESLYTAAIASKLTDNYLLPTNRPDISGLFFVML